MTSNKTDKKIEKEQRSSGKKGGRGTHGSISKAGKVRSQTVKIPKTNLAKHHGPSVKNRIRYAKSLRPKETNTRTGYRM